MTDQNPTDLAALLHSYRVALILPLAQAALRALAVAVAVGAVVVVVRSYQSPLAWMLGAFGVTLGVGVWISLSAWDNYVARMLWAVERQMGADLDGDGAVGEPAPIIRVEVVRPSSGGMGTRRIDELPATAQQMGILARGLLGDRPFSEREWASGASRVFGQTQWARLTEAMLKAGLVGWIDPDAHQQGLELTDAGWALMEQLAAPALPSPTGGGARE